MTKISELRYRVRQAEDYAKELKREFSAAVVDWQAKKQELRSAEKEGKVFQKMMTSKTWPSSSVARYKLFNEIVSRNGYTIHYRDRLKSGGISVKVFVDPSLRKVLRSLCDEVSRGTSQAYNGFEMSPTKYERYIFHNIPGKSKYAKRRAA